MIVKQWSFNDHVKGNKPRPEWIFHGIYVILFELLQQDWGKICQGFVQKRWFIETVEFPNESFNEEKMVIRDQKISLLN